jgi:hypothetical protein
MILIIIIHVTKLARFVKKVQHKTQRLRRTLPAPTEEVRVKDLPKIRD